MVALGVVVVLFVVGWILARELYANEKIEDCVMSGRTNCVPIDTSSHLSGCRFPAFSAAKGIRISRRRRHGAIEGVQCLGVRVR